MAVAKIATKAMNIPPKTLVVDPLELTGRDEVVGAAAEDLAAEEAAEADEDYSEKAASSFERKADGSFRP